MSLPRIAVVVLAFAGCTGTSEPGAPVPTTVTVTLTAATINVGATTQASAVVRDADGAPITGVSVTWSASGSGGGAATVNSAGVVTALAAGVATVTATVTGTTPAVSGTAQLTMVAVPASVSVTLGATMIWVGTTTQASAVVRDEGGTPIPGASVTWSVAPSASATVSTSGLVTALDWDVVTITATVPGTTPPVAGTARLTIRAVPATVTLSVTATITEGGTSPAFATVKNAAGATIPAEVTWSVAATTGGLSPDQPPNAGCSPSPCAIFLGTQVGTPSVVVTVIGPNAPLVASKPVAVYPPLLAVDAGSNHACGLSKDGLAFCWGDNSVGQVGDGTVGTNRLKPTAVAGGITFASIAAGNDQSCGLTAAGVAYCWGLNRDGQVGDNTTTDRSQPTLVAGGLSYKQIVIDNSTCALTQAGAAWCWGYNGAGQLGDGTGVSRSAPVPVAGGLVFASLTKGDNFTCGRTVAGDAYCWGDLYSNTPTLVPGGHKFVEMVAGYQHVCGRTTTGVTLCWGNNSWGQLGDGTIGANRLTPAPVASSLTFTQLAVGFLHTCGLAANSFHYCWGTNGVGQLGLTNPADQPVPTFVFGGLTAITAGDWFTCGRFRSGYWGCWGRADYGQNGTGTTVVSVHGGLAGLIAMKGPGVP